MKNIILLLLALFTGHCLAQTPDYFEANQEWVSSYSFYSPGLSDCVEKSLYVDYVNGDTIISGTSYKKIGRRHSKTYTPLSSIPCPNESFGDIPSNRLFRQSNDSIFEYLPQSNTEELLISYNLGVGDSFTLTSYINTSYSVEKIDTITLNGQNHKVFIVDTVNHYSVFEGLGHYSSFNGGFFDYWGFGETLDHTTAFYCCAQNDNTVWDNPAYSGQCNYLNDLSIDENVVNKQKKKELIKIIDLTGRETKDQPNTILIHIYSDGTTKKVFRTE